MRAWPWIWPMGRISRGAPAYAAMHDDEFRYLYAMTGKLTMPAYSLAA